MSSTIMHSLIKFNPH